MRSPTCPGLLLRPSWKRAPVPFSTHRLPFLKGMLSSSSSLQMNLKGCRRGMRGFQSPLYATSCTHSPVTLSTAPSSSQLGRWWGLVKTFVCVFFFWSVSPGMWDLNSLTRDQMCPLHWKRPTLDHWGSPWWKLLLTSVHLYLLLRPSAQIFSRVRLFSTPWTRARQAPLPMGFSRQEYWSGVPLPSLLILVVFLFLAYILLIFQLFSSQIFFILKNSD